MAQKKQVAPRRRRIAGESGNKFESVKNVVRDREGRVIAQPGDVKYVRDQVAPADEAAREAGEV